MRKWIIFFFAFWGFLHNSEVLHAEVGVIPEASQEPEFREMTLKLVGRECVREAVQGALLNVSGIVETDLKAQDGAILIYYIPEKVTPAEIRTAVARKKTGCLTSLVKVNGETDGTVERTVNEADEENKVEMKVDTEVKETGNINSNQHVTIEFHS